MSMLDTPRIHPSAGVPRALQPIADAFDTYHVTITVPGGRTEVGRVRIARTPYRSAGQQRRVAMSAASFKYNVPVSRVKSAVKC